jgi:hypothetical protein
MSAQTITQITGQFGVGCSVFSAYPFCDDRIDLVPCRVISDNLLRVPDGSASRVMSSAVNVLMLAGKLLNARAMLIPSTKEHQ